jgi:hypothetical protein
VIERIEGKKEENMDVQWWYNIKEEPAGGGWLAAVADCCTQLYYIRDLARVVL